MKNILIFKRETLFQFTYQRVWDYMNPFCKTSNSWSTNTIYHYNNVARWEVYSQTSNQEPPYPYLSLLERVVGVILPAVTDSERKKLKKKRN